MPRLSPSSFFYHPNNIWWGRKIIKLLAIRSSPLPCYLAPLMPKYLPLHSSWQRLYKSDFKLLTLLSLQSPPPITVLTPTLVLTVTYSSHLPFVQLVNVQSHSATVRSTATHSHAVTSTHSSSFHLPLPYIVHRLFLRSLFFSPEEVSCQFLRRFNNFVQYQIKCYVS